MKKEKEIVKVIEAVERCLLARSNNGALKDESDFLAGAMIAMSAFGIEPIPFWTISIMSGRSVVDELKKEKKNAKNN